ncbi:hypothetical protein PMAYCL1PPCAC_10799 [Pristionchus mayeri]|uniref:Uncharacterized protein n=1 Tax=Pristionchus mayeri TaxID=1317129 RepID=A0AAN4ZJS4_9BILA|nr:hypothetical protein PMAYCL1PPCAC_10799 [Pristionchus mayeri]
MLGASVAVTCPFTCGVTCTSAPVDGYEVSTRTCLNGRETRTCPDADLAIQTDSGPLSFSKAACLGEQGWLGFNCDGTAKKFAGPLEARCPSTAPTTTMPTTPMPSIDSCPPLEPWCTTADLGGRPSRPRPSMPTHSPVNLRPSTSPGIIATERRLTTITD